VRDDEPGEASTGSSPTREPRLLEDYPTSMVPKPCESVRAARFFRGIEANVNRRFSDRFQMQASYLYSKLAGNYGRLREREDGFGLPGMNTDFDTRTPRQRLREPLARPDAPVKLSGYYVVPFGLRPVSSRRSGQGAALDPGDRLERVQHVLEPRGSWDQLPRRTRSTCTWSIRSGSGPSPSRRSSTFST